MRYPILIEEGSEGHAFGIVLPDLPGCFSAGDTLDEAIEATKEAAAAWIDAALDDARPIPRPSSLEEIRRIEGYAGWAVGVVELDTSLFDDHIERVNITLPRRILRRLDDLARLKHLSRGAFISELTLKPDPAEEAPDIGSLPIRNVSDAIEKLAFALACLEQHADLEEASNLIREVTAALLKSASVELSERQETSDAPVEPFERAGQVPHAGSALK